MSTTYHASGEEGDRQLRVRTRGFWGKLRAESDHERYSLLTGIFVQTFSGVWSGSLLWAHDTVGALAAAHVPERDDVLQDTLNIASMCCLGEELPERQERNLVKHLHLDFGCDPPLRVGVGCISPLLD